jgi:AcrR family transcriptional regulator
MDTLTQHIELQIPNCLFQKNPRETEIGNKLVETATHLIAQLGLEQFTIKKLALETGCTEATVYRYFENKHQLMLYIMNIFWGWQEYLLVFSTQNIHNESEKMKRAIALLANPDFGFLPYRKFANSVLLAAINEGVKIHIIRNLKDEIENGSMAAYRNLAQRIAGLIKSFDKTYAYPHALAMQLMDAAIHQQFCHRYLRGVSEAALNKEHIENFLIGLLPKRLK